MKKLGDGSNFAVTVFIYLLGTIIGSRDELAHEPLDERTKKLLENINWNRMDTVVYGVHRSSTNGT